VELLVTQCEGSDEFSKLNIQASEEKKLRSKNGVMGAQSKTEKERTRRLETAIRRKRSERGVMRESDRERGDQEVKAAVRMETALRQTRSGGGVMKNRGPIEERKRG